MDNSTDMPELPKPPADLSLAGILQIPAVRQISLLLGVAVAVAAGFAIVLWSQSPGYVTLDASLSAAETAEVRDALIAADMKFRLKEGRIEVPQVDLQSTRLHLASQGLAPSAASGMSAMQEQSSFGVSQFMENARYQHALESELARTISSLGAVSEARVHLALPKQSSFLRHQKSASASVFLNIRGGMSLTPEQAAAVVNLVAASVPDLSPKNVTVVDRDGRTLSDGDDSSAGAQANSQFKHARKIEETYKARIEQLLTPLVGMGRVRAEVVADIDFTVTEEARESYDPSGVAVRSEFVDEDIVAGAVEAAAGVPGAVSNEPPESTGVGSVPVQADDARVNKTRKKSTRNYEVDRTIRHTRPQAGTIRRLSVAVLIDEGSGDAEAAETALTEADIERYTALVREAVGFDAARGDSVVVLSEAFRRGEPPAELEPPALWEQPVVRDILKQVLGAALVLAIAFGVVRPMLRSVVSANSLQPISGDYLGGDQNLPVASSAQFGSATSQLASPSYDEKVTAARNISSHDPMRVAQVVKKWVAADV